ncbi:Predicted small secreted protein [Malonomonas rubra DSM 5091]|uniref:Predicted small secreted protein n=1 Tax=Malonomonas rubra DSM 5091 TaxID=1122189 RepID=A0A1M6ILD9_MALRU|nr:hypothetical protein [Malonomonas rubra]SHJ35296.1 Predicted small secreted protein [Malonomonas rubra DSM 5091]
MIRIFLILLLVSSLFISGCECTAGFGRDLQKAGSWIERNSSR